jgi:hypothetical protein
MAADLPKQDVAPGQERGTAVGQYIFNSRAKNTPVLVFSRHVQPIQHLDSVV